MNRTFNLLLNPRALLGVRETDMLEWKQRKGTRDDLWNYSRILPIYGMPRVILMSTAACTNMQPYCIGTAY